MLDEGFAGLAAQHRNGYTFAPILFGCSLTLSDDLGENMRLACVNVSRAVYGEILPLTGGAGRRALFGYIAETPWPARMDLSLSGCKDSQYVWRLDRDAQ